MDKPMTAGTSPALAIHGKQLIRTPRIGLALGGGGARGLAHIAMLEAFDELGIRPSIIAGTSIGALYGAAYASGISGKDLRDHTRFILAQRFGLPVYAANDANCIAVVLRNKPEFQAIDNMAVLMLGTGVGMGLIVGGKVYDGRTGAAAEFGHTKYQMDGPFCHCGRRGCIESFVGDYALYRDARAMLDLPNTDALHPSEEQMQVLCDLAAKGDPVALGLFEQAGRALGFGLTNLIALISPSLILVSGSGVRAYKYLEPSMRRGLRDGLVETLLANTEIRPQPWDEDLTLRGITALVQANAPYQPS